MKLFNNNGCQELLRNGVCQTQNADPRPRPTPIPSKAKLQNTGPLISISLNKKSSYCYEPHSTKVSMTNLHVLALCGPEFCSCSILILGLKESVLYFFNLGTSLSEVKAMLFISCHYSLEPLYTLKIK